MKIGGYRRYYSMCVAHTTTTNRAQQTLSRDETAMGRPLCTAAITSFCLRSVSFLSPASFSLCWSSSHSSLISLCREREFSCVYTADTHKHSLTQSQHSTPTSLSSFSLRSFSSLSLLTLNTSCATLSLSNHASCSKSL